MQTSDAFSKIIMCDYNTNYRIYQPKKLNIYIIIMALKLFEDLIIAYQSRSRQIKTNSVTNESLSKTNQSDPIIILIESKSIDKQSIPINLHPIKIEQDQIKINIDIVKFNRDPIKFNLDQIKIILDSIKINQ